MDLFAAEGVKVYAISYDPQPALKDFAETYGITYALLSDEDSAVIKKFGILNTLVKEDDREKHPATQRGFYGVPFPGTYVVDAAGVVTEKFFFRHYGTRVSAGSILNSALGKVLIHEESPQTNVTDEQVKITAFLADESLKLEYASTLYLRFELAEGLHLYGEPLPKGFIATEVSVAETAGLRAGVPVYPATRPFPFEELGVTLNVYEGVVDVAIPITVNAEALNWNKRNRPKSIDVKLDVRYQVCSDSVCYLPKSETLSLAVPLGQLLLPGRPRSR